MTKGICKYPLIACRKDANERAEMVSQLLYGESYEVIEDQGDWLHIRNNADHYESWIDSKLHHPFNGVAQKLAALALPFQELKLDGKALLLPGGSMIEQDKHSTKARSIVETANAYLGAPYLWGGKSVWGIDCSGFVQVVFSIHGIVLPRDAYQQAEGGEIIEFNELIEAGDLAFFSKEDGRISHVGICLGEQKIIHASGEVRIDKLDHHGIFNSDKQKYTHELRMIKRMK
jgi:hypothetical protein